MSVNELRLADPIDTLRFMFAVGIECSCPTIADGQRVDQLRDTGHYDLWKTDLRLVRELGLRYLRYGPPIYKICKEKGKYDWDTLDPVMNEMRRLGIIPIIDLVHFGIVVVVNIMLGLITPPYGLLLFIMANISGEPLRAIVRDTLPFLFAMLAALALFTFVPGTVLWLPRLLGYQG